jgi:tetratricopeptide (TPR) repeat protein
VKKALLISLVILLVAAALLQWGLDRTPAGTEVDETGDFPTASSLLDLLGGARQYLAFTYYIKTDKLHHTYYGSAAQEAELVPYFKLIALLDPNYISAYYVGAGTMDVLGKREEAIAFTLQGIEANPESADLYYSLGDFYLEEKNYGEAREAFEEALKYESELVNRNMLLTALAAACGAMGDEEAQRRILMEKAIYNQIRLYDEEYTYEQGKTILELINLTLNSVADIGEQAGDGESGQ